MAKLIANMSMSLDGYVADTEDSVHEVFSWLSSGTEVLEKGHITMRMTERNRKAFEEGIANVGACLTGRRTSDLASAWHGEHPMGVPTYVVSHRPAPDDLPAPQNVYFVDGIEEAARQAKEAAGDQWVGVAGGDTVRQLLELGLLDEIRVDLVPYLLGSGVSFFGQLANAPIQLDGPEVTEGDGVTHLHYRVVS